MLGEILSSLLKDKYNFISQYFSNDKAISQNDSVKLNLAEYKNVKNFLIDYKPDIIIHTAAISRPDVCESMDFTDVKKINVTPCEYLTEYIHNYGEKIIYTSTDLVYDGNGSGMLTENSMLNPASVYAKSKLEGEDAVKETSDKHIILRQSLMFGFSHSNAVNNFQLMYQSLSDGKCVNLFDDQFRTPMSSLQSAKIITEMINKEFEFGIYNHGGDEKISRYDLGNILCNVESFNHKLINKISMNAVPGVNKVKDVSMNCTKLRNQGFLCDTLEQSVIECILRYKNSKSNIL